MFDHVYLNSLIIILVVFTITIGVIFVYEFLIKTNRLSKSWKISLREYSVYIKYNFKTKKYSIENIQDIEIESMEKQFRRLSNQIEFSTISISCTLPPNTTDTGFITPDFSEDFKDFAYNALQFISDFGICILYILVIGIPLVLLIAVLYWVCFGKIGLIRKLFDKLKP